MPDYSPVLTHETMNWTRHHGGLVTPGRISDLPVGIIHNLNTVGILYGKEGEAALPLLVFNGYGENVTAPSIVLEHLARKGIGAAAVKAPFDYIEPTMSAVVETCVAVPHLVGDTFKERLGLKPEDARTKFMTRSQGSGEVALAIRERHEGIGDIVGQNPATWGNDARRSPSRRARTAGFVSAFVANAVLQNPLDRATWNGIPDIGRQLHHDLRTPHDGYEDNLFIAKVGASVMEQGIAQGISDHIQQGNRVGMILSRFDIIFRRKLIKSAFEVRGLTPPDMIDYTNTPHVPSHSRPGLRQADLAVAYLYPADDRITPHTALAA